MLVAFLGQESKSFEVAEAVVADANDLSRVAVLSSMLNGDRIRRLVTVGRRRNLRGVPSHAVYAGGEVGDVTQQDRIPPIARIDQAKPPFQDREQVLVDGKDRAFFLNRESLTRKLPVT